MSALDFFSYIQKHEAEEQTYPFSYYHVENVLSSQAHAQLSEQFQQILNLGLSETDCQQRFKRFNEDIYDAYVYVLPPDITKPLSFFYSHEWMSFISDFYPELVLEPDVASACHHHRIGSNSGFIHNDFTTSLFYENTLENGINPWFYHSVKANSKNQLATRKPKKLMRSIMVLYYLNNPDWSIGDGGETCIYTSLEDQEPAACVPPLSNSVLIFEVTPQSYHAFRYNSKHERNCIVQSYHSTMDFKLARHPNCVPTYNDV